MPRTTIWKSLTAVLVAAGLVGGITAQANAEHATRSARRVRGQLVLRTKAGASERALERALAKAGILRRHRMRGLRGDVVVVPSREIARVERELRLSGLFKSVERDYLAGAAAEPNDPQYPGQWGLPRTGVPAAWDLSLGGSGAPVAILDTGVDYSHPDLAGSLLAGYDFVNDDADPSDDHGHGTRMTGIVAARWNNGVGVAGLAPSSPIIPVKVLGEDGLGPYSAIAEGITWAVDQGARVINLSLSGSNPSQALQDAVNYATANGAVCVAAAGNDGSDDPVYPAATSGAVAVAAIDQFDNHAWFSNTGAWLSHSAPGVSVLTTDLGGGYSASTGTSPAAAFSSGIFSLLFAYEPTLSPASAIARVESGAFDLGANGWDPSFGWGGIDALASLVPGEPGATPPDQTDPYVELLSPTARALVSGNFGVEVAANDDVGIARVELFLDNRKHASETNPPYSFVVDAAALTPGKHKLRAYAFDAAGNRSNTRNVKVLTTPGVGLLVKRAKVVNDKVRISASFALPEGIVFDPTSDAITVTLEANGSTLLLAEASPADLRVSGAKTKATVSSAVPNEGTVQFKTSTKAALPNLYKLKIKASDLTPMAPPDDVAILTVEVGGAVLSQPLSFRSKGTSRFLYP
jgi:subtilisin family serine protease